MARSKNISTPPIRKKPPPEQKATPISARLRQPSSEQTPPPAGYSSPSRVLAATRWRESQGRGIRVLWASDNHMEGILRDEFVLLYLDRVGCWQGFSFCRRKLARRKLLKGVLQKLGLCERGALHALKQGSSRL